MNKINRLAETNAELFIKKHFSNLNSKDQMVKAMKTSVEDTIKQALLAYQFGN
jgi:hypothetical protein